MTFSVMIHVILGWHQSLAPALGDLPGEREEGACWQCSHQVVFAVWTPLTQVKSSLTAGGLNTNRTFQ